MNKRDKKNLRRKLKKKAKRIRKKLGITADDETASVVGGGDSNKENNVEADNVN